MKCQRYNEECVWNNLKDECVKPFDRKCPYSDDELSPYLMADKFREMCDFLIGFYHQKEENFPLDFHKYKEYAITLMDETRGIV